MKAEAKTKFRLQDFNFPNLTDAEVAFSVLDADPVLLKEARERGYYDMNSDDPYCKMFSTLFFRGGKVKFKKDIDVEFQQRAWRYLRSFMGSWTPKHEEKQAIAALILSEIVEPELE